METKFSLYFSLVKNAFVWSIFLMSQGDVSAQQPAVVSANTVAVVSPAKKAEDHAVVTASTNAVVHSPKTVDSKISVTTSSVAVGESVKKVEDKKVVSEVVVVPTSTNAVAASAKKVEDHAVVTTSTNAVVDPSNKAVAQTAQAATDVKKDAPVLVLGPEEVLKAELLAELTKVIQKQVKEEVNAKIANPNVTASETANISSNVKPSIVADKDGKLTAAQKPVEVSASVKVQKTPCNMLTAATCGENPACGLHNKFCRTNCVIIPDESACTAASDCEWYGAFKRSCEFKK